MFRLPKLFKLNSKLNIFSVVLVTVISATVLFTLTINVKSHKKKAQTEALTLNYAQSSKGEVLAANTDTDFFTVNIPGIFTNNLNAKKDFTTEGTTTLKGDVFIQGKKVDLGSGVLTAPNILYSLKASGDGIKVSGGQDLTVSNTGVTSFQGQTGSLNLTAGTGITISGLTISSSTTNPNTFKTITIGSDSFSAGSSTDTLTFAAGSGVTLSTDTSNKKITFSSSSSSTGWSLSNSIVNLSDSTNSVGVGTSNPSAKFDVAGTASVSGQLALYGTPTIQSTANQTLTLGGDTTGNLIFSPLNGSGTISFTNLTTNGGVLYTNASGILSQTGLGNASQCLFGGTVPTWGSCNGSITNGTGFDLLWTQTSGLISPNNSTLDFVLGSQASSSAKFGVLNLNSGTPTASISATTTGTGLALGGDGTIQSFKNGTLTLGGNTTGNIVLSPLNGSGTVKLSNFSTNGGLVYANGSGVLAQTGAGSSSQCLSGGTTPTWITCASNTWQEVLGAVSPTNITDDLLIGGTATSSAIFQVSGTTGAVTLGGSSNSIGTATAGKWTLGANTFTYRRTITITNNDGSLSIPSGYQVTLSLSGATATDVCNNTRSDNNDIRVATSDPTEIARNITRTCGSPTLTTSFLTQSTIAASGTGTYYLYYSNSALASAGSTYSYTTSQVDSVDSVATWTASDSTNTPIAQDTSIKNEGTGSVKITTVGAVDGGTGADGTLDLSLGSGAGGCTGTGLTWTSGSSTCTIDTATKSTFNFTSVNVPSGTILTATGTTYIQIKATGTVTIAGTVNISASGQTAGAGGNNGGAGGAANNAGSSGSGTGGGGGGHFVSNFASGGCGGGFGGAGGKGGSSNDPADHCVVGATYSTANAGGSGGGGGGGNSSAAGGSGGGGGGSFQVSAAGNIAMTGTINANGGAAASSLNFHVGGGGGGSGGSVGLTTAGAITGSGTINANGGAAAGDNSNNMKGGGGGGGRITLSDSDGANTVSTSVTGNGSAGSFGLTGGASGVSTNSGLPTSLSVNDTVIATKGATDLSSYGALTVWVRSDTTGTNFTFGYGVSAITEHTSNITINSANTWEQKTIDISATSPRTALTKFGFTVTSSGSSMNFWFDDLEAAPSSYAGTTPTLSSATRILGASSISINSQGTGGVLLNYDPTNSAAGTGGLTVYNGVSTALFAIDSSGNASQSGGLTFSASSSIQTTANQTLTIGGNTTGNIILSPLNNLGFVGIGTSSPKFTLDVSGSQASSVSAMVTNSNSGANASVLGLKVGATTPGTGNYFMSFLNGNGAVVGKIQGNGSGGVTYSTSGIDFAEYYKKDNATDTFEAGDLVCLGQNGGAIKCNNSNKNILGAVSDRPGFAGGTEHENDPAYLLVGLVGQLPVKISTEKGVINASDPLTVSSIDGVAAKATSSDFIVGRALQKYDAVTSGKVLSSISPTYYVLTGSNPATPILQNTNIQGLSTSSSQLTMVNNDFAVSGNTTLNNISILTDLTVGNNLKIGSNSIDTIGQNLEIQSMKQGGVSIMKGLVAIDTQGNVNISGNLSVLGTFTAKDAKIDSLSISNHDVTVVSDSEVTAKGSSGQITLKSYQKEIKVDSSLINSNTLIFLTPITPTGGRQIYVKTKDNGKSFTVGVENAYSADIQINFLIIN